VRRGKFKDLFEIAPKTVAAFNQDDFIARFGGFCGRSHAGQPAAHHQNPPAQILCQEGCGRFRLSCLDDAHPELIFGQHPGVFIIGRVRPDDLLPQVDPFHYPIRAEVEDIGHHPWRTGGNHERGQSRCLQIASK